jgi:hypothetical protein
MNSFTGAKAALDAATDQALAIARDNRRDPAAGHLAPAVEWLADLIGEQFPGSQEIAGRVLMAVSQFVCAAEFDTPGIDVATIGTVLAFAAEQVVREAGQP